MDPCEAPYTILGVWLQNDRFGSKSCSVVEYSHFFKDYAIREFNALLWISLIVITFLLLKKVMKLVELWDNGSKIPGPPCPSSLYGHSRLFTSENFIEFLSKAHEEYGSIVRLWFGPTQLLVSVKDPSVIKEMLVKAEDKLPSTGRAFRLAFGKSSLFASSFEKVQKRRESLAVQLNNKFLERAHAIPSNVLGNVMERIASITAKKGVVDCRSVSQHMAFCVLGSTLFGDDFLAWSNATVYEDLLKKIAKEASFWASYSIPPFWRRGFWRYKCLCARLRCLTREFIQQRRQNYKLSQFNQNSSTEVSKVRKQADSVFASGIMEEDLLSAELDGHLNNSEPCGNIMGVMFHGCLTTAGLIGSILTRLVMHPEIQDKIYSEIVTVGKRSTKSEAQNIHEMNLLLATVYESARLLPSGPLLQRCSQQHDVKLKAGTTVPAGTILVVPVQLVQMDRSTWGNDAGDFNPNRFLSKADEVEYLQPIAKPGAKNEVTDHVVSPLVLDDPTINDSFLSFGSGTRTCIGQKFAVLGIATLFASLLQHYEIKLEPGYENDPKPMMNNCVLQLLPSPNIVFVKRNC